MPDSMAPREKLSDDERREITLAALGDANKTELAAKHQISRRWIYFLLDEAMEDPEGKLAEAEKEAEFRRRVKEILDARPPKPARPAVPDLTDKTDNWLISFTQQAILARNEQQVEAAGQEWHRRGRDDVMPREMEKWAPKD